MAIQLTNSVIAKNEPKNSNVKTFKRSKKLKNLNILSQKIIETKQNIYVYVIIQRKMSYLQKNNLWIQLLKYVRQFQILQKKKKKKKVRNQRLNVKISKSPKIIIINQMIQSLEIIETIQKNI